MNSPQPDAGIAVIGMAGRFPGAADVAAFWQNLKQGVNSIRPVQPGADGSTGDSNLPGQPGYVGYTSMLDDADTFDAKFFGIYPRQAQDMDPQHRVFLECCWHAMEDAGYIPGESAVTGVFAGCHMNTYIIARLAADAELRESLADGFPGGGLTAEISNDKDYLATRVAFQLNLRGPAIAVQSACSTSLVAIAQACESLEAESCDMALAGGVTITFPQNQGYLHTPDSILSPDGCCRTFDADARGTVFGDGAGAVLLKRVADARRDGDDIYAVIRGWGVNNDGRQKQGYTAPSVEGQTGAILKAHRKAGIDAGSITYVEAHGTGTQVGDPIEIEALTTAFRESSDGKQFCAIGSLKSNVGHLDVAAGVTGLIKTSLAVKHGVLPPSLHFKKPNPRIDFENSPFYVNTELANWQPEGKPRRAGLSSFGVGGTNAHLLVEQPPEREETPSIRKYHLLPLSAQSEAALEELSAATVSMLRDNPAMNFADICHTLQTGRTTHAHTRTVVAGDAATAADALEQADKQLVSTRCQRKRQSTVAMLFPGQGSQHLNMARGLYDDQPIFKQHFDECAELLAASFSLHEVIFAEGEDAADRLSQTAIAQPAIFAVSYAMAKWWQSLGVQPAVVAGHSAGEFAAACIAGVFRLEDAARLVLARGELMQALPPGSMLAVRAPAEAVQQHLPDELEIAAINSPATCVVSGPTDAVQAFSERLENEEITSRLLQTSHAFHSAMMDPAVESFANVLADVEMSAPQLPLVSTVTGKLMTDAEATSVEYWSHQIRRCVKFSAAIEAIADESQMVLMECGPAQALSTLARQNPAVKSQHTVLSSLPHPQQETCAGRFAIETAGKLWQAGVDLRWAGLYPGEKRNRVHLPVYPFQRKRFWFEVNQPATASEPATATTNNTPPATATPPTQPAAVPQATPATSTVSQQVIGRQLELMQMQLQAWRSRQG